VQTYLDGAVGGHAHKFDITTVGLDCRTDEVENLADAIDHCQRSGFCGDRAGRFLGGHSAIVHTSSPDHSHEPPAPPSQPPPDQYLTVSPRAAIIALIICIGLAVGAWWVRSRPSPMPPPVPTSVPFEREALRSLSLFKAGSETRLIERSEAGQWILRTSVSWPIEPVRIRAAAGLIEQLLKESAVDNTEFASSTRIVVEDLSGNAFIIELADDIVGGRVFARILTPGDAKPTVRITKADFASVFSPQGLDAWRSPSVFTVLDEPPLRINLRSATASTAIRRNLGRWGIERSPTVPADPERVKETLASLASLAIERFAGAGDPMGSGLQTPVASIVIETSVRGGPDEPRRSIIQTLDIGSSADAAGRTVSARMVATWRDTGDVIWGPQLFTISAEQVVALKSDPAWFVSRLAMELPAADIIGIHLSVSKAETGRSEVEWERTLAGWTVGNSTSDDAAAFAPGIIDWLKTPALVASFTAPMDVERIAILTPRSQGQAGVSRIDVYAPVGEYPPTRVFTLEGDVWRTANPQAVWLALLAPSAPGASIPTPVVTPK